MRLLLVLALLLAACAPAPPAGTAPSDESPTAALAPLVTGSVELSPASCPAAAQHVYHPARLALLNGCQEAQVRGTLTRAKAEPDGDFHVLLGLDPGQQDPRGGGWTNPENVRQQHGDLVLEPVCEHAITQRDAVAACTGWSNPLRLQAVGRHILARGYWVLDRAHGWNELHPLTDIQMA